MENVFGEVLEGTTETLTSSDASVGTNTDTSELGSEYDLDLSEVEGQTETEEEVNSEEGESSAQELNAELISFNSSLNELKEI